MFAPSPLSAEGVLESSSRASLTGAANLSAGPQPLTPRIVRPQQAGRSKIWPAEIGRRCSSTFCWRGGNSISHWREALVGYLQGRQAVDRAGCLDTPTAKGSRPRGAGVGALRSFSVSTLFLLERALLPLVTREAPSGLHFAPTGLRGRCGAGGRGESAAAGRRRRAQTPRFLRVALHVTQSRRVLGRAPS